MSADVLLSALKTLTLQITRCPGIDDLNRSELLSSVNRAKSLASQIQPYRPTFGSRRPEPTSADRSDDADKIFKFLTQRTAEGYPQASTTVIAIEVDISVPRVVAALKAFPHHFKKSGAAWRLKEAK